MTVLACAEADPPTASQRMGEPRNAVAGHSSLNGLARALAGGRVRRYGELPDTLVWKFIAGGDSIAIVGLKRPDDHHGVIQGRSVLPADAVAAAFAAIERLPDVQVLARDTVLPKVRVRLKSANALLRIRSSPFTDYVDPDRMYDFQWASGSGCGQPGWTGSVLNIPEGDIMPFTYPWMHIDRAWGLANGQGVTIGHVDTGTDVMQPELAVDFSSGAVPTRTISRSSAQFDPTCSHGTRLAGVMAAPKNGRHVVGVAWGANLFSYMTGADLIPSAWEAENGIRESARAGAKVILMAWGTGFAANNVNAEIDYWYGQGVSFVGAAGTWPCDLGYSNNVLWPAEKREVIAVSPAHYDGNRPCAAAYGPALDLIAYHGQPTTGTGAAGSNLISVEQSSNAAAIVAGAVALMRQRFATITPDEVQARLLEASNCLRPSSVPAWHRMLNAEAALGGMCIHTWPVLSGPGVIEFAVGDPPTKTVTYVANTSHITGGAGRVSFHFGDPNTAPEQTTLTRTYQRPSTTNGFYFSFINLYAKDHGSTAPPFHFQIVTKVMNKPRDDCGQKIC
jgi:subtilisin family serine protease